MKTNNSTLVSLYKNLSDKVGVVAPNFIVEKVEKL